MPIMKSSRTRLLERRVRKAQKQAARAAAPALKNLSVYSVYDRINSIIGKINDLDNEEDTRTGYDRLIEKRRLEREILVLAEHAIKKATAEMRAHFQERYDSALRGIAACNERLA